ncbi:glycoside hydrolase family 28 protein [Aaosphaeria arxii CBS 175.79]|uniref:Glycoside hydrolase family 28 protein n=1 Tax=Aaosphaeria arxii CBS 175.79 TaxID=1450172 RepID=A0A6A5XXY0_9PLEO|nr:glycoside hydrolase family 28 protein [Aaosphaeria arxii CBS 175.79]KAF2017134.1 glycoside hydrolase family 28 protein [Aaosphaeria arxii CBS 175.79]
MVRSTLLLAALSAISLVSAKWVDYDRPEDIYAKSGMYSVKVNGTYAKTVSYNQYDYLHISMSEGPSTEFRVAAVDGQKITEQPVISPKQLPIVSRIEGNELIFSLKKVHYLIIKFKDKKELIIAIDPLETDVPPSKGDGIFNVLDYGADNKGKGVTTGIQKAMDAAAKKPGSIVYVPPGLYLIGNLMLRNRTSLYLAGGSVLRNTAKKSDYKVLWTKSDLGDGTWWIQTEFDSQDIKVYGRGTLDGNGKASVGASPKLVADILVPVGTTNFKCDGILVRDSSFWAVSLIQVTDATITNIKIFDRFDVKQNDGIDVNESTKVRVRRAIAVANDDSFSTKTWPQDVGTTVPYPYPPRPLRDVIFDDCFAWTYCYAFKVGQGVYQEQDGVTFKNGVVYRAGVGLGIHHLFGTAAAKNVRFENMDLERVEGEPGGTGAWLAVFVHDNGKGVGPIQNVYVKNIRARKLGKYQAKLAGVDEKSMVDTVTFSDVFMLENKTAATNLDQLNVKWRQFSKNIKFDNTK